MTYTIQVSDELVEPDWDTFLLNVAGGHHVQSSMWGNLKTLDGWWPLRCIVREGQTIVGGFQILLKRFSVLGAAGYVSNGPVCAEADREALYPIFMAEMQRMVKKNSIRALFVQPPIGHDDFVQYLDEAGFELSSRNLSPTATVLVDLAPEPDTILAQMKQKTRYNIRYAGRKGITIRQGGRQDLPVFHRLLNATSDRQEFEPESLAYFQKMYDLFEPDGHLSLTIAEYEGEAVSAILLVAFNDTVIYKRGGWSGENSNLHPNEAVQWGGMVWSKEQGYNYYNLEGINLAAAKASLNDEPIPDDAMDTPTRFKLGYGGTVTLLPRAYAYIPNPLLRWTYNKVRSNGS